ncbi:MAG: High-affinity nickel-transporter [Thermoleophilia bacterium]
MNRSTEVVVSGGHLYARVVLDLAEIPTFQARERAEADLDAYGAGLLDEVVQGLDLRVDGARRPLEAIDRSLTFPEGQGGLRTTRLEAVLDAGALGDGEARLTVASTAFPDRLGWRELVVRAERGARLEASTAPSASSTDGLRTYPDDLLSSPLDVREATAVVRPGAGPGATPALDEREEVGARPLTPAEHGFEALVGTRELTAGVVAVALLVAAFWGAAHALSPGHGKGIVAAYLVGTRGTARHAVYLGVIVTVTHTLGVFALGAVTLVLSEFVVPERLYPWLNLVAALLVVAVGIAVLRQRVSRWTAARRAREAVRRQPAPGELRAAVAGGTRFRVAGHAHGHGHGHDHAHGLGHDHAHVPEPGSGWRGLLAVGISSGLVPCPTALVVLLAAISLHRVGFGMLLIVAFGLGLAGTITAIGLLAVLGKRLAARASLDGPLVRLLPALSSVAIVAVGLAMTIRALPSVT